MRDMLSRIGVGIDIVDVARFKKTPFIKNKSFYEKIFSLSEIKYCLKFKDPYIHFAAKFAMKEATKKSTNEKIHMLDIITSHTKTKPKVSMRTRPKYDFLVSVSHDFNVAVAIVISKKTR